MGYDGIDITQLFCPTISDDRLGLWSQVRASRQIVPGHLGDWGAATNGNPCSYGCCRVGGPTLMLPWKDSVAEPFHLWGFRVSKHHTSWDLRWSQGSSRPLDIALRKFEPPQLQLVDHATLWLFDIAMENGSFMFIKKIDDLWWFTYKRVMIFHFAMLITKGQ